MIEYSVVRTIEIYSKTCRNIPKGAKIATSVGYYPMFANKTKISASFGGVVIVTDSQDDAQKARVKEASHRSSVLHR